MDNSRAFEICKDLIEFNTITPGGIEILEYIEHFLSKLGFKVEILTFTSQDKKNVVHNLYAEYGSGGKNLGFLGHLDVVPPGEGWDFDPFKCTCHDGFIYGRGIADMKGGAGCFLAALEEKISEINGRISVFLTCDEEVGTYEGGQALLDWAQANNKLPDHCLIGEPSSDQKICDRIYIGHRGSINILATAHGVQSHSAYVANSGKNNALEKICAYVHEIMMYRFKHDDLRYPECTISPTLINNSNIAENVVPDWCCVNFNVRFSADYTFESVVQIFKDIAKKYDISIEYKKSGDAYICEDGRLLNTASRSILDALGYSPKYSAGGGTSDGRFMNKYCPVIEFGMPDGTIHKINEHVRLGDCEKLTEVYKRFLEIYFSN